MDKADSPVIPESYVYLLGLQCLVSICEGFASYALPLYTAISSQRARAAGEPVSSAPPSLDLSSVNANDTEPSLQHVRSVAAMIERGWPGLLSALSFLLSTNLADDLFAETLGAFQNITNVSGVLSLTTPRDAFLTSLSKCAIPPGVVSSVDAYVEPSAQKTGTMVSDALGFSGGSITPPGLSERNMACLKSIVASASYLSGSLGSKWFDILEMFQNADYVMTLRGTRGSTAARKASMAPPGTPGHRPGSRSVSGAAGPGTPSLTSDAAQFMPRHPLLMDLDIDTIQSAINRLLDATKSLDDDAFKDFITSLCRLSKEMIGMQAVRSPSLRPSDSLDDVVSPGLLSAGMSPSMSNLSPFPGMGNVKAGRRVSGMGMPKAVVRPCLFTSPYPKA